jgi:hypothetical protein
MNNKKENHGLELLPHTLKMATIFFQKNHGQKPHSDLKMLIPSVSVLEIN